MRTGIRFWAIVLVVAALACGSVKLAVGGTSVPVFGKQALHWGSSGGDVYELQGRLAYLGYYHGRIDGKFGYKTYWALRNFQYKFGMKVDGVAGAKTKLMLWKATKNWRAGAAGSGSGSSGGGTLYGSGVPVTSGDLHMLAQIVNGEARGEPYKGQVAVAAVILNRVASHKFPNSVSGVIFQPGAFTAVDDGQIWLAPSAEVKRAVRDAANGWDPSGGALYYFNPSTATSGWIWSRPQIMRIGKHIFTK